MSDTRHESINYWFHYFHLLNYCFFLHLYTYTKIEIIVLNIYFVYITSRKVVLFIYEKKLLRYVIYIIFFPSYQVYINLSIYDVLRSIDVWDTYIYISTYSLFFLFVFLGPLGTTDGTNVKLQHFKWCKQNVSTCCIYIYLI